MYRAPYYPWASLCILCVLCVSVVIVVRKQPQRHRGHRECPEKKLKSTWERRLERGLGDHDQTPPRHPRRRSRSNPASLCKPQECTSWLCIQCIDRRVRTLPV